MKYFISLAGFIMLLTLPFLGMAQGTVRGTVMDAGSGEGLAGARITVIGQAAGGMSDAKGRFSFKVPVDPPFQLKVNYVSYDSLIYRVASFDENHKLRLNESSVKLKGVVIEGISITEKQKEAPLTVESLSSIAIKEVAGADFYASLGNLKGVDMTSASLGFKVINTRGFNSTSPVRSLQIIDGVDNQAPGLNFSLGNFLGAPELDVQKVDLIQGASSAFYGPNAFNGVISMTTKSPFLHQGLSVQGRVGERNLLEGAVRYARAFKNKSGRDLFAFKVNAFFLSADDWPATNMDPTPQSDVDETNPGGYDAVNRYGDENLTPGINNDNSLSGAIQRPGLFIWHRDGYKEEDLVDYDTENIKLGAAMHFKLREDLELIGSSNFGTGTTVYQGDNRYSLRDILFFQQRVEIKQEGRGFFRAYATHEDAGNSYDAVFTAFKMNEAAKSDAFWSRDYRNYWTINVANRVRALPGMPVWTPPDPYDQVTADSVLAFYNDSLLKWHQEARDFANTGVDRDGTLDRFEPGTERFDSVFQDITSKTAFTEGGTRFFDKSALYHAHGEYKFLPGWADVTVGGNFRLYTPNSDGTIFSDTNGRVITNWEYGVYAGLERRFIDDRLKVNATARLDKNVNFPFLVSPAASVVYNHDGNNIFRGSFSSAIRNPTLAEQYLYYNVGRAILLGNVDGIDSLVEVESLFDFFDTQNRDTLVWVNIPAIVPEKVRTFEVGYRGTLFEKLYVDAGYYFSFYRDFIGFRFGADINLDTLINRASINRFFRVAANASDVVTTQGFSIGLNYYFKTYYMISGNYSWNRLDKRGSEDPIIPAFNTPEHKFNIGFGGRNIKLKLGENFTLRDWGFNINFKWIEGFTFEGSPQFTGFVPTYSLLDAQINKTIPKIKTTIKIGGSNLIGRQQLQVFGGPYIGRLAYISIRVDLDNL